MTAHNWASRLYEPVKRDRSTCTVPAASIETVFSPMTLVILLMSIGLISCQRQAANPIQVEPSTKTASPTEATAEPVPTSEAYLQGQVLDLDGRPVNQARISARSQETVSDDQGRFQLIDGHSADWITVEHPDYLSRTRAAAPGKPVLIRLTPDDGETISINFGGDTMFGRRYYDRNEDGILDDGLLSSGAGVAEHLALLSHVQPLLQNADLTVLNLESPLAADPYVDPTRPRPERYHLTKEYVFASDPMAAVALRRAGVDIVDIGNNHLYDLLDEGILSTRRALEQAGFAAGTGYFGAGMTEAEAWQPALTRVRGQTLAFLGCTSITGYEDAISYVVSDEQNKGGAAACNETQVRAAISTAKTHADVVVFMVHGGIEYDRDPSEFLQQMTTVARESGATLVINHTPHVVGGFDWDGSSFVAWTLGNFMFDQTVWPTFETYLLTVHLRRGQVIRAFAEPLIIEDYQPRGVTGEMANYVARGAAGRGMGPFLVEDGAMEADLGGRSTQDEVTLPLDGDPGQGSIARVPSGWAFSSITGTGRFWLGRDLLWTGSFEDEDVDAQQGEGVLWDLSGSDKLLGPEYAHSGQYGIRLQRVARNENDVVLTPIHRILVEAGADISVIGMVRADSNAELKLQLSWYPDTRGPSNQRTVEPIDVTGSASWHAFRHDVTVPPDMVAVGLYLRMSPPFSGEVTADFDDVRLIQWDPPKSPFSWVYDHIRVVGPVEVGISRELMPGIEVGSASAATLLVESD